MDIAKLVTNIDEIQARFNTKTTDVQAFSNDFSLLLASNLINYVSQYKKYLAQVANYLTNTDLQNLPIEYYQICAKQYESKYEEVVEFGLPKLLNMNIIDKTGKLK